MECFTPPCHIHPSSVAHHHAPPSTAVTPGIRNPTCLLIRESAAVTRYHPVIEQQRVDVLCAPDSFELLQAPLTLPSLKNQELQRSIQKKPYMSYSKLQPLLPRQLSTFVHSSS